MVSDTGIVAASFLVYIAVMLVVGFFAWRKTGNFADYVLGGRRLGSWVTALSAGASDMSGWLLLGLPGYAYASGLEAGWIALGLLIGTYFNWRIIAARLRCYSTIAGDCLTLPDFFEQRFRDSSRLLRIVSAFFILLFFLFYTGSGLVAAGKLFNAVFDLPYHWAVASGAMTILVYTFVGGFLAVSWTDVMQGLLMCIVLVVVPLMAMHQLGGWDPALAAMAERNAALLDPFSNNTGSPLALLAILSLMSWGLGYFGQPHILARFKAVQSIAHLPKARRIAVAWVLVSMLGALAVGYLGIAGLDRTLTGADTEKVFIFMVNSLFHPVVAGICLAAILAAIMSTADSQLLVSASVLTGDFYSALLRRRAGQAELVWTGRVAVLVITAVAVWLAWDPGRKVLDLVAYAWAGFGAAFGPTLIGALYWKRMNRCGALAGIMVGGITVVIWKQLNGGLFDLYEIVPGFVFSLLAIVIVTLVTTAPGREIESEFEQMAATVRNS